MEIRLFCESVCSESVDGAGTGLVRIILGSFMVRARNDAEELVSCYRVISVKWTCHQSMSQELAGNGGEKGAFFVICSDDFLVLGSLCESIWPTFPRLSV